MRRTPGARCGCPGRAGSTSTRRTTICRLTATHRGVGPRLRRRSAGPRRGHRAHRGPDVDRRGRCAPHERVTFVTPENPTGGNLVAPSNMFGMPQSRLVTRPFLAVTAANGRVLRVRRDAHPDPAEVHRGRAGRRRARRRAQHRRLRRRGDRRAPDHRPPDRRPRAPSSDDGRSPSRRRGRRGECNGRRARPAARAAGGRRHRRGVTVRRRRDADLRSRPAGATRRGGQLLLRRRVRRSRHRPDHRRVRARRRSLPASLHRRRQLHRARRGDVVRRPEPCH